MVFLSFTVPPNSHIARSPPCSTYPHTSGYFLSTLDFSKCQNTLVCKVARPRVRSIIRRPHEPQMKKCVDTFWRNMCASSGLELSAGAIFVHRVFWFLSILSLSHTPLSVHPLYPSHRSLLPFISLVCPFWPCDDSRNGFLMISEIQRPRDSVARELSCTLHRWTVHCFLPSGTNCRVNCSRV